jgi:predicted DNA-binding ribbon-helix-helix protein
MNRTIHIHGTKVSVYIETAYWEQFRRIAKERGVSLSVLASELYSTRRGSKFSGIKRSLSQAIRMTVLDDLVEKLEASQREVAAAKMAGYIPAAADAPAQDRPLPPWDRPEAKPEPVKEDLPEVKVRQEPSPEAPPHEPFIRHQHAVTDDGRIIRHRREFNPATIAAGFEKGRIAESSRAIIDHRLRIDGGGLSTERRGIAE